MANYYAAARSNWFKVKDVDAFIDALSHLEIEVEFNEDTQCVACFSQDPDGSGWPASIWDDDTFDNIEIDYAALISPYLLDGEVAVFEEAGHEKLRYLNGSVFAIYPNGEADYFSFENHYAAIEAKAGHRVRRAVN